MTIDSVARKLRRFRETAKHAGKFYGVTVAYAQESGTSVQDLDRDGYVYVQLRETETQEITTTGRAPISVRCFRAADYKEGVYVVLEHDVDGELHVASVDEAAMLDAYGALATSLTLPARSGQLDMSILPGWRFGPLRVRQSELGGLKVVIEDGIYEYRDSSYAWLDKEPIDLSTVSVSTGKRRAVIVGIDPATNTSVIAYSSEADISPTPYTLYDYNGVRNDNPGKIWLFGYERRDGVTAFKSIYDLIDIRAYISPGSGVSSGGSFMPIELDYTLTIPANSQVIVRRLTLKADGVLNLQGVLDLIA